VEPNREWLFRQLRDALRLLAADGDTALAGVPDGCCKPDELALDFHYAREAVVGNFAAELPPGALGALAEVDAAFGPIAGDGWSEAAVRAAPEWAAVRERAGAALASLGWAGAADAEPGAAADRRGTTAFPAS
jgi:hypothetical protein